MIVGHATWLGADGLKQYALDNALAVQRNDENVAWRVFVMDSGVMHETRILKDSGAEQTDFEASWSSMKGRVVMAAQDSPLLGDTERVITAPLKNGGSSNMAVNGSSTPQVFQYNPTNKDVELNLLTLIAETTNALALGNKFIDTSIATLTNGLLIELKQQDVAVTYQLCKRTRDLIEVAAPAGVDLITGTSNLFRIVFFLPDKIVLAKDGTYANPDYIRATVRDNLTAISYLEMFLHGEKLR